MTWNEISAKRFNDHDDKLEKLDTSHAEGQRQAEEETELLARWTARKKEWSKVASKVDCTIDAGEWERLGALVRAQFVRRTKATEDGEDQTREFVNVVGIEQMDDEVPGVKFARMAESLNLEVLAGARDRDEEMLLHMIRHFGTVLSDIKDKWERRAEQSRLNGNPNVKSETLHAQVCREPKDVSQKFGVQCATFRLVRQNNRYSGGKDTLPKIDLHLKFDVACFKKKKRDKLFVKREKGYFGELRDRAKKMGQRYSRLFGGWPQAKRTFFPAKYLRTDQNVFICHARAHLWLSRVLREHFAGRILRLQSQEEFNKFFRVCFPRDATKCSFACACPGKIERRSGTGTTNDVFFQGQENFSTGGVA